MNTIAEDLEDATRRHNSKIFYWHTKKLRGNSQPRIVPDKDRNRDLISDEERLKEKWAKYLRLFLP